MHLPRSVLDTQVEVPSSGIVNRCITPPVHHNYPCVYMFLIK